MTKYRTAICLIAVLFMLSGCAAKAKSYVVLMENADGSTGAITVSNSQGTQLIDKKRYGVDLYVENRPLQEPYQVNDEKIKADFEQTMTATPETPISFLLYFELGESVLTRESQQKIDEILSVIKKRKVPTVGIIGHTDLSGDSDTNEALGLSRAEFIKNTLLKAGVSAAAIVDVASHGENNPLIKTAKGVQEPRNRRVEVVVW